MSIGKAAVLSLGFVGAVALGMWIRPYVLDRDETRGPAARTAAAQTAAARATASSAQQPSGARSAARPSTSVAVVPASEPALQKRLKNVLNQGTNLEMAAEGFRTGEQFAAVAHAARNTGTPFVVLKDRVVTKRMSLAAALRDVKPDVNATAESDRARSMARADVAAVSGN